MNQLSTLLEPVEQSESGLNQSSRSPAAPAMVLPPPDWLDRGQIPCLDGLRAIAVSLVLIVHAMQSPGFPESPVIRHLADHGHIGVDIFFVISGFLITTLLARELERTGTVNLKRFYVRRFLRIIPAYLVLLLVVAACQMAGKFDLRTRDWVAALTYTTNFLYHPSWELGHTWSLSVEEHFYFLWPFALFVAGLAGGWRMALSCIVGCWGIRCFIVLGLPILANRETASYYSPLAENCTFTRLDTISMGCLLALASRSDFWRGWLDRLTRPAMMFGYFATICAALELGAISKFHHCVYYSLSAACIALLMWGLIRSEGLARRIMSNRVLMTMGIGSYSIYLWQQLFIHPKQVGWIHAFPQNIALSLVAACLSFWIIERPCNRLKDRVAH